MHKDGLEDIADSRKKSFVLMEFHQKYDDVTKGKNKYNSLHISA